MQDEERYMTLNLQWKKRSSIETSQLKFKGMVFLFFPQLVWVNMNKNSVWVNLNRNTDGNFQHSSLYCSWTILFFGAFFSLSAPILSFCLSLSFIKVKATIVFKVKFCVI